MNTRNGKCKEMFVWEPEGKRLGRLRYRRGDNIKVFLQKWRGS
jgi:hypothetical protein